VEEAGASAVEVPEEEASDVGELEESAVGASAAEALAAEALAAEALAAEASAAVVASVVAEVSQEQVL